MNTRAFHLPLFLAAVFAALVPTFAREVAPNVSYAPNLTIVEGDQPLSTTFVLSITAPSNVQAGFPVEITPLVTILTKPADVSDSVALSYVTLTPPTLTFGEPGQVLTTTVHAEFPVGTVAGAYAYKIMTPGWKTGTQDGGAFINATVFPQITGDTPTVVITTPTDGETFTYYPLVGPLSVPVQFTSSALPVSPITTIDADVNGAALALTNVNHGDGSFTSTGTATITSPGIYTVRARASNTLGTGIDTVDFNVVVSAPPPTVAIAQPVAGSSFTLPLSGSLSVPYSFSAHSNYGGITSLTATLNGAPVAFSPAGLGTLDASGSGAFNLTVGGTYELVVVAVDANGSATTSTSFTVVAAVPPPTVSISQPLNGATFTRVAGSAPTQIPFTFTGVAGNGYTITSLTGTLNSSAVSATVTGLGSGTATGTGTLSVSGPGTFTLTAVAGSGTATAATSVTFTVTETQPPAAACSVNWLPPIARGKTVKGGSNFSIKFELLCEECGEDRDGDDDPDHFPGERTKSKINIDRSVVIAISEIFDDNTTSAPQLFPYSSSPNAPGYTIQGNDMYHLNFPVPTGEHRYRVEVYRFPTSSTTPELLGTREFTSK